MITVSKPTNQFGAVRKNIEISFPAQRLTIIQAQAFARELLAKIQKAKDLNV